MKNYFKNKTIFFGPFVGSFEYEIIHFKPFIDWFKMYFSYDKIIIMTHHNTKFLYSDDVLDSPEFCTNNPKFITNLTHKWIPKKDYKNLKIKAIDDICKIYNKQKSEIINYDIGYGLNLTINNFQKCYVPLIKKYEKKYDILFIPDKSRKIFELREIYKHLKDNFNVLIVGEDLLMEKFDNYDTIYKDIMEMILNCKCVITPCSIWTLICNLHGVPVFSWGKNTSQLKTCFDFGNKNLILNRNKKMKNDKYFYNTMEDFIKENN